MHTVGSCSRTAWCRSLYYASVPVKLVNTHSRKSQAKETRVLAQHLPPYPESCIDLRLCIETGALACLCSTFGPTAQSHRISLCRLPTSSAGTMPDRPTHAGDINMGTANEACCAGKLMAGQNSDARCHNTLPQQMTCFLLHPAGRMLVRSKHSIRVGSSLDLSALVAGHEQAAGTGASLGNCFTIGWHVRL